MRSGLYYKVGRERMVIIVLQTANQTVRVLCSRTRLMIHMSFCKWWIRTCGKGPRDLQWLSRRYGAPNCGSTFRHPRCEARIYSSGGNSRPETKGLRNTRALRIHTHNEPCPFKTLRVREALSVMRRSPFLKWVAPDAASLWLQFAIDKNGVWLAPPEGERGVNLTDIVAHNAQQDQHRNCLTWSLRWYRRCFPTTFTGMLLMNW